MYQRGEFVGVAAGVFDLWPRRLLRLIPQEACDDALPRNETPGHALDHAWRPLDLVLRS